jgi:hypothetical protein
LPGIERLGGRHVHRVVRGEVVPQRPGAIEEVHMAVTLEIQVGEVGDGLLGSRACYK